MTEIMMTEGEAIEQLVEFTNVLLLGVSVFFTVVSAYIAALNYFIGSASFLARLLAFFFITATLGMLAAVMFGAQITHAGLIARLRELGEAGQLSAAGQHVLQNAQPESMIGRSFSLDDIIRTTVWTILGVIYVALGYLTFFHRWRPESIPVILQNGLNP